jgi:hypothetical protein
MFLLRIIQGTLNIYMPLLVSLPHLVTIQFTCDVIIANKNKDQDDYHKDYFVLERIMLITFEFVREYFQINIT